MVLIFKLNKPMITEIKNTNLVAVEVPSDSHDYRFGKANINILMYNYEGLKINFKYLKDNYKGYKILGTVTKDKINFDCEPYLILMEDSFGEGEYKYRDYTVESDRRFRTKEESFYSRLAANGLYFENPLDWEKKAYLFKGSENSWGYDDLKRWQSYEDKLIKGKLLIIEKL